MARGPLRGGRILHRPLGTDLRSRGTRPPVVPGKAVGEEEPWRRLAGRLERRRGRAHRTNTADSAQGGYSRPGDLRGLVRPGPVQRESPRRFRRDSSGTRLGATAGETLGLRNKKTLETMIATMPRFVDDVRRNAAEFGLPQVGFIADGFDCLAPSEQVVENIRRWNADHRRPPIRYSSTAELFAAVEKEVLPVGTGEMPSPWDSVQSQGNGTFHAGSAVGRAAIGGREVRRFRQLGKSRVPLSPGAIRDDLGEPALCDYHNWGGVARRGERSPQGGEDPGCDGSDGEDRTANWWPWPARSLSSLPRPARPPWWSSTRSLGTAKTW